METIYVAQARCGLLKIGRTKNPVKRLQGLRKEFKRKGAELVRFAPCEPTTNGYAAENMLLTLFGERLPLHSGREWFYGGLFENAARAAQEISEHVRETRPEAVELTREQRAAHKAKWAAHWAQIKAAKAAVRLAHAAVWRAKTEKRREVRLFRATVCARIAQALTDDWHRIWPELVTPDHPAPEPQPAAVQG